MLKLFGKFDVSGFVCNLIALMLLGQLGKCNKRKA